RDAAEQARQRINRLIAAQTEGNITDLLAPGLVSASTRLVLASAVYLKAAWAHPFPAGGTHDAPFHPAPGTSVTVAMMQVRARLRYLRGGGYQAVELPYAGGRAVAVRGGGGLPGGRAAVRGRRAGQGDRAAGRARRPDGQPADRGRAARAAGRARDAPGHPGPAPVPGHQPVRAAPGADRAGHAAGVH